MLSCCSFSWYLTHQRGLMLIWKLLDIQWLSIFGVLSKNVFEILSCKYEMHNSQKHATFGKCELLYVINMFRYFAISMQHGRTNWHEMIPKNHSNIFHSLSVQCPSLDMSYGLIYTISYVHLHVHLWILSVCL